METIFEIYFSKPPSLFDPAMAKNFEHLRRAARAIKEVIQVWKVGQLC